MQTPTFIQKSITTARSAGAAYGPASISAYVSDQGLAYHQSYHGLYSGQKWTVTHVASGHTLCNETTEFKNEAQCKAFIARVSVLCDWAQEKPAPSENTKVAIRRIATECQAAHNYTPVF
jgi:hypothetical protein